MSRASQNASVELRTLDLCDIVDGRKGGHVCDEFKRKFEMSREVKEKVNLVEDEELHLRSGRVKRLTKRMYGLKVSL